MKNLLICILLLNAFCQLTYANELKAEPITSSKPSMAENLTQHSFHSEILNQKRTIDVYLPPAYHITSEHVSFPVIYLLDSEFLFHPITGVVQHLSMSSLMPDSIVIGINNYEQAPQLSSNVVTEQRVDVMPKLYDNNSELAGWGNYQADKHLQFLADELIPFIEQKYRTNNFRMLTGLSPTATFTLYSAWKREGLFDVYIAMNHWSLLLEDEKGINVIEHLSNALGSSNNKNRYLYLSQIDYFPDDLAQTRKEYALLQEKLNALNSSAITFKTEILSGYAYHTTLDAFISAMEMAFPRELWEVRYRNFQDDKPGISLANLKNYYQKLHQQYGFEVLPKLRKWWATGDDLLALSRRTKDSLATLEYALSLYGRSAEAHALLADELVKQKQLKRAIELRKKAVELAQQNNNIRLAVYKQQLNMLKQSLKQKGTQ